MRTNNNMTSTLTSDDVFLSDKNHLYRECKQKKKHVLSIKNTSYGQKVLFLYLKVPNLKRCAHSRQK